MNPTITRKEVAELTGLSERTVRRNEETWGLRKVSLRTRTVLYSRVQAMRNLQACGFEMSTVVHTGPK